MNAAADLTLERLSEQHLLDAWPLIELGATDLVSDWWRHEAAQLLRQGGGVLVARRPDGLVHGLATYRPLHRPGGDTVLAVTRLITFELSRKRPVRKALLQALDRVASQLRCSALALPSSR